MALILDKIGIVTGNTVEAYHVTQSIDAFTGTAAYDITLSGSLQVTGSVAINGLTDPSKANILTYDTTTGQVFYTASNGVFNPSSYISNSQTSSFVTNSQTSSMTVATASSCYVSSSMLTPGVVGGNEITFFLGDGSTHLQTINTGSGGGGGGTTDTGSLLITASHVPVNDFPAVPGNIEFTKGDGSTFNVTTGKTWITASNTILNVPTGSYGVYINWNGSNDVTLEITGSNIGDEIEVVTAQTADGKIVVDYDTGQIKAWDTQSSVGGGFETDTAAQYPTFKLVYVKIGEWHLVRYTDKKVYYGAPSGNGLNEAINWL